MASPATAGDGGGSSLGSTSGGSGGALDTPSDAGVYRGDAATAQSSGSGGMSAGAGGYGGGVGGAGGAAAIGGDPTVEQCLADALSAGQTVDDCIRCMCQTDKCQAQLNTATHDSKSNAVVVCSQEHACTDVCCLCGTNPCGLSNYATGPCAAQVEAAAGVTPGGGLAGASTVASKCARNATDDNSCYRVTVLADCERTKCADVCPVSTTCP
jgi:hypothetical protein